MDRVAIFATATAIALAGCGAGANTVPPPRAPVGQAVGGHLYTGALDGVDVYPLAATGAAQPERSITGLSTTTPGHHPSNRDLTSFCVRPDGTISALLTWYGVDPQGNFFDVATFAPSAQGASPAASLLEYQQGAHGRIACDGSGNVEVLRMPQAFVAGQRWVIDTLPSTVTVAAGAEATPLRRLTVGRPGMYASFTTDGIGRMYVLSWSNMGAGTSAWVDVYPPGAADPALPQRSFTFAFGPGEYADDEAAAPDGTFFVLVNIQPADQDVVRAYATGSGTVSPALTVSGDGGFRNGAIATDAAARLYVLHAPRDGHARRVVDVFSSGTTSPARSLDLSREAWAIAVADG